MSENSMRKNLVTTFHCHECGTQLSLSYKPKDGVRERPLEDGFTGAAMVGNRLWIEPCHRCKEPAEKVMQAVKTLMGHMK